MLTTKFIIKFQKIVVCTMSTNIKLRNTLSSYYFFILKIFSIFSLALTVFIPIFEIHYTGSEIDSVLTYYSLSSTTKFRQGTSSGIPTTFGSLYPEIVFLIALACIIIAIGAAFAKQNQVREFFDIIGLIAIFTLVLNYFIIYEENGQVFTNVKLNMTIDFGFYLIILSFIFLLCSTFFKFKVKESSNDPSSPI